MVEKRVIFDADDIEYLITYLQPEQLRKEIHHAEIERAVAMQFGEDDNVFWWEDYGKACELALDVQRSNRPKRQLREGALSIQDVKEANDIVDVVSRYTDLRKGGKEYTGKCPFHNDKHPSLNQLELHLH